MAKKYLRQQRSFSATLKRQIVLEIESGKLSAAVATREYMVSSTTIYRWIHKYSAYNKKGQIMVIDNKERLSQLTALQERVADLERVICHKQMQIDYYEKFVEIASDQVGVDLKKKYAAMSSAGFSKTKDPFPGQ